MKNKSLLKRLMKYVNKHMGKLIISLLCAVLYVVATLSAPIIVGLAIDQFIDPVTFTSKDLNMYILILTGIVILGAIFGFLMNYLLNKITYSVVCDLRCDCFKKIINVPVKYLDSHLEGDVIERVINDTEAVADGLLQGFQQSLTGILTILATIVLMLIMNWILGLIVIVLTPLSLFVAKFIASHCFSSFKKQAEVKGAMTAFSNEMITNQKIALSYQMTNDNIKKFNELDNDLYKVGVNAQFYSALTNPSTRIVNNIVYAIVATIGAIFIIYNTNGNFLVGQLTAFLTYASQYTKPFNDISSVATELSNSFASLKRVYELIDENEITETKEGIGELSGNIKINDIKFGYVENKTLIHDVTLDIKQGMHVAIVGPTGCGKTTLINLIMRFYDVNSGSILMDDKNIYDYSRESLRDNIGMVLQDTWVFKGTVFDNIQYAKPGATKEEVIEAAKRAYADDFIMHLDKGYDTIISDDDSISQGQKQLLCIARLMLKNPNILILDEATSNIDTRTEIMVQNAFNRLMDGHTSFIIAHRLSTIKNSDMILVMKDGNIIESGTHEKLLEKKGFYSELYNSQFN